MKGLVIWAQSNCRSTMALYRELIRELNVPAIVTLWYYHTYEGEVDNREAVGFRGDEFADVPTINVGENLAKGMEVLDAHPGWHHIFTNYQQSKVYRELIGVAKCRGEKVAVFSESPNPGIGLRSWVKRFYLRFCLSRKLQETCANAEFFVNYSGDDSTWLERIGWKKSKIIPFGYYSPPIEQSKSVERTNHNDEFIILATGVLTRYRGADILLSALKILKKRGVRYRAVITQKGELYDELKKSIAQYDLPVTMPGFVQLGDLIRLYETCNVYVGAGRREPWGMRLNDALLCGAPLVVSTGMGGVKLVRDHGCGLEFCAGDALDLANKLQCLIQDRRLYESLARKAKAASLQCTPEVKARELVALVNAKSPGWWED